MSLQEGIVPVEWKVANIIPLFKKGSRNKSVNYRPVSLTSILCKLLETIIRDHMMDFLGKLKLINTRFEIAFYIDYIQIRLRDVKCPPCSFLLLISKMIKRRSKLVKCLKRKKTFVQS